MANTESPKYGSYNAMLVKRNLTEGLENVGVVDSERQIAAMLIQRGTGDLAGALKSLFKGSDVISH